MYSSSSTINPRRLTSIGPENAAQPIQTAQVPDSAALHEWASSDRVKPEANAARWEIVRRLESAVKSPTSELDLRSCDRRACMDLPASVVRAHATRCTTSEPPTSRLILPSGLKNIPVWIVEFKATLKQVTAPDFAGSEQTLRTNLRFLSWTASDVTWDFSPSDTEDTAKLPATLGSERLLDVQSVQSHNALRSIYRPYIGELDEGAKAGLERFMNEVRDASPFDPKAGIDYNLGGFKVVRSDSGKLELSKLATPPYVDRHLDPDSLQAKGLPKAMEVFNTLFGDVQVAVWQMMSKCGYVDYLTEHAAQLVDGPWDILININPYFSRSPRAVGAHKDTEGENMFIVLCYRKPRHGHRISDEAEESTGLSGIYGEAFA
jgi:hypothetical protein